MRTYLGKREASLAASNAYIAQADCGNYAPIYRFGEDQIHEDDIEISETAVKVRGLANAIALPTQNPFADMTD